jgi:hypothetical protein
MNNNKQKEITFNKLLRSEIVALDHYCPPRGKTRGQG